MDESFPGAENAFWDAFNLSDPTPKLLEIIRTHPDVPTITDLVVICMELLEKAPTQIGKFIGALVNIKNSEDITVAGYNWSGNPIQIKIAHALSFELHELLRSELAAPVDEAVTPSNGYLISSLFSAMVLKFGLCDSPAFPSAVEFGLDYQNETGITAHEVLVLGTCLQLSISGSYLCDTEGLDASRVLSALDRIRNAGVLKDPNGQQLLEVTIKQIKGGYKDDVDGWGILFPQS